jgi:hypothetical protein
VAPGATGNNALSRPHPTQAWSKLQDDEKEPSNQQHKHVQTSVTAETNGSVTNHVAKQDSPSEPVPTVADKNNDLGSPMILESVNKQWMNVRSSRSIQLEKAIDTIAKLRSETVRLELELKHAKEDAPILPKNASIHDKNENSFKSSQSDKTVARNTTASIVESDDTVLFSDTITSDIISVSQSTQNALDRWNALVHEEAALQRREELQNERANIFHHRWLLIKSFKGLMHFSKREKKKRLHREHQAYKLANENARTHYQRVLLLKVMHEWHRVASLRTRLRRAVKLLRFSFKKASAACCLRAWHQYVQRIKRENDKIDDSNAQDLKTVELRPNPSKSPPARMKSPNRKKRTKEDLLRKALVGEEYKEKKRRRKKQMVYELRVHQVDVDASSINPSVIRTISKNIERQQSLLDNIKKDAVTS